MKIFADNFAISFELKHAHQQFAFETHDLEAIATTLIEGNLFFQNQVFYADAEGIKKKTLMRIHRDPQIRTRRAHLILLFETAESLSAFQENYIDSYKKITAAGGLVVNQYDELLMMVRNGKWDLPKGKLEIGEALTQGAWREVAEETGISDHRVGKLLCSTYHIFERREKWRFKTTHWYVMATQNREKLVPQLNEGITHAAWIPLADLREAQMKTYPQIMELVALICATHHSADADHYFPKEN